jgi:cytochrome c-type biogenesis protein
MAAFLANLSSTFLLGPATPLTAVCVIPLYPGFIAFLANSNTGKTRSPAALGLLVVAGTLAFMTLLGVVFTTVLQVSLTRVVGIISPLAFGILLLVSLALLLDLDLGRLFPTIQAPTAGTPLRRAFLFGFFFGAIVLPCNPGFIAIFFAKTAAVSGAEYASGLLQFAVFGLGIGAPLMILALISGAASKRIISWLVKYKSVVNRSAGALMLVLSLFFLVCDFHVFGIELGLCRVFIA